MLGSNFKIREDKRAAVRWCFLKKKLHRKSEKFEGQKVAEKSEKFCVCSRKHINEKENFSFGSHFMCACCEMCLRKIAGQRRGKNCSEKSWKTFKKAKKKQDSKILKLVNFLLSPLGKLVESVSVCFIVGPFPSFLWYWHEKGFSLNEDEGKLKKI